jgi:hypothetical protein
MSRFSSRHRFRKAGILPVLIPLSLIPVFLTVSIVAYFFSVANGYRPLPEILGQKTSATSPTGMAAVYRNNGYKSEVKKNVIRQGRFSLLEKMRHAVIVSPRGTGSKRSHFPFEQFSVRRRIHRPHGREKKATPMPASR